MAGKRAWVRLYGRGGADDGYAAFASLAAILALQDQDVPHARCVVIIEACEESGSFDLPAYIDHLGDRIGSPSLVVCLDSGAGNYEQLWLTVSLRGVVNGRLSVEVLREGVVPSSFRVLRQLLDRIEDAETGELLLPALQAGVPSDRLEEARRVAEQLGDGVWQAYRFIDGVRPMRRNNLERVPDPVGHRCRRTSRS